ncbi:MAG: multicopper oxidase domain-containing protein, partial [Alicyclobacillaceae bacterium]|nr:multicopper oxidase domain-containing protein [Alicyclobacillaceae bacterium]
WVRAGALVAALVLTGCAAESGAVQPAPDDPKYFSTIPDGMAQMREKADAGDLAGAKQVFRESLLPQLLSVERQGEGKDNENAYRLRAAVDELSKELDKPQPSQDEIHEEIGRISSALAALRPKVDPAGAEEEKKIYDQQTAAVRNVTEGKGMAWENKDGVKVFHLTAEPAKWFVAPGVSTEAWTFNGQAPGPTIRVTEGDRVQIVVTNKLPEPLSVHWHGLHVPNDMDGVPEVTQKPIAPGESYTYTFTAGHPGTFMYHSHTDDLKQVGRGLYGAFIIDPRQPDTSKDVRDFTMILSSWHVRNSDPEAEPDFYTINGRSYPATVPMDVKQGERVRVRIINIDTLEVHTMHLHGLDFRVVAKDGHPYDGPVANTLLIGPGETYDVEFRADVLGKWMFHCHILDHTMSEDHQGEMGGLITLVNVTP